MPKVDKVKDVVEKEKKTKKLTVKKETTKIKVEPEVIVSKKEIKSDVDDTQKAYFFPRLIAYIIDMVIITMLLTVVMMVVPQSENYETYLKEYQQIQTDFLDKKINTDEYVNKSVAVVHDIDYSNVMSMIIEVVVIILYFVIFQAYNKGQTFGKKLMHIKVVSKDGSDLTVNNYIFRSLIVNSLMANILIIGMVLFMNKQIYYYASFGLQGIQIALIVVSMFMMMYKKDGRGIQDLLGNTKVIMYDEVK